jgi:hypothetical protein
MTDQHRRFLERLRKSSDAVEAVACWLERNGFQVEVPQLRYAPTAAEHEKYSDNGDIIIIGGGKPTDIGKRVEVKQITPPFTGPHDWPFKEAFVSGMSHVDKAGDSVLAYVTVNHDLRCGAVMTMETRPLWYVRETLDRNTGNMAKFYACPLSHVLFRKIA